MTSVQTLADGTKVNRESTETDAQDSQSRHMQALTEITLQLGRAPGTFANVHDPVGGTQGTWDSRTRKARGKPDPTPFQPPEGYEVTIVELCKVDSSSAQ